MLLRRADLEKFKDSFSPAGFPGAQERNMQIRHLHGCPRVKT